ncbi:hypothetical protein [Aliiglaciecola sp. LCG003]|uniref:hypothetical protein n=1 Tax=Aliiglaciecola sp. LCG003 TaxID=3053655 RepID=UPI0025734723|nr:hypothetical protein [Aliiglaciecola sp. LCG003]WJG09983.1 hypothetical protein QR722_02800 [Aliiglaciecola sp. LCG003]
MNIIKTISTAGAIALQRLLKTLKKHPNAARGCAIGAYLLSMLALQQVVIIPLIALILILAIYKSKSAHIQSHAKFILSVYAGVSAVVWLVASIFTQQQSVHAIMFAVAIGFSMLVYGAVRAGMARKPFSA